MKTCLKYGPYMNVGYVPDSFGMAGNMPQIYNAFGIKDTLFWRGVTNDMVKHTDYNWRGHDGSTVFVTQIPHQSWNWCNRQYLFSKWLRSGSY